MISQLFNIPSLNTRLKRNSTVQANPSTASLVSAARVDTGNDQSLRSSSATQAVNLESLVTQYMPGAIRRDILTINAHQREADHRYDHSYGKTGGANKDGLAMAIKNRLETLYPHAGHSDEAGKKALRASAKKLKLSDTHNDQLEEKLKASYCNHPLALCLKHLSTQPEATTLAFIRELASAAGCATGRANQVYFALLSVDSAALFSGSSVSIIPPRHSKLRNEISSRLVDQINRLIKDDKNTSSRKRLNLEDDLHALKKTLKPLVVETQKSKEARVQRSQLNLSEAVFGAIFPEVATNLGYELAEPSSLEHNEERLNNLIDRIRTGASFKSLVQEGMFSFFEVVNALTKIPLLELIHHTDFDKMLSECPGVVLKDIKEDGKVFQSILSSLRFGDPNRILFKLGPHLPIETILNAKAQEGSEVSLLHLAAEHNDLTLVKNVLEKADSPKQRQQILDILDGDGNTPLLTAAGLLNTDCRNYLISQGASINIKNYEGQSIYSITLDNAPSGQWSEMEDLLARVTELGIKPRLNHLDIKGRDIHDLDPKYQPLFSDVVPQSTIVLQSTIDRNGARTVNSPLHRVLDKLGYVMEPREAPLSAAQVRNVLQSNSAILDHWEPAILSYVRELGNRCTFDGDVFALKRFATEARFSHKVHVAACDALRAVLDQVSRQPSWGWSVEHIVTLLANMEDLPADLRRMALSCINR